MGDWPMNQHRTGAWVPDGKTLQQTGLTPCRWQNILWRHHTHSTAPFGLPLNRQTGYQSNGVLNEFHSQFFKTVGARATYEKYENGSCEVFILKCLQQRSHRYTLFGSRYKTPKQLLMQVHRCNFECCQTSASLYPRH